MDEVEEGIAGLTEIQVKCERLTHNCNVMLERLDQADALEQKTERRFDLRRLILGV